jgi:hypothetical protein
MKLPRRQFLHLAAGVAALPVLSRIAMAQAYPTQPITLVAPFPAGGPVDLIARILGEHIRGLLGQPVLVENVAGAAGSIGVGRVARAAPNGYTLIVGQWSTHVANAAIYKLQYDTLADFQPIALLSSNPGLIVGRKNLQANNLNQLIAWLKANPEKAGSLTIINATGQMNTGSQFHEYEILEQLKSSETESVYRARHIESNQERAIKFLVADLDSYPNLEDRFLYEGKILTQLRHPNLARVYEYGVFDRSIDVHIGKVRRKLADDAGDDERVDEQPQCEHQGCQ